jgi:outer membrane protein, heavy metal efflux system
MRLVFAVVAIASLASPVAAQPAGEVDAGRNPLTLADAEALALASHPAIAEAASRVRAARSNCLQVGLPPNPTIGYVGSEIGDEGTAGQQGMYVGQQFIRGNKLELNRQVACQEVRKLEQQLIAQRLRVLTAVRIAFFEVYLAQREIALAGQLVDVSRQATQSVEQLLAVKEARRIDVLQAQIELQRIDVKQQQAVLRRDAAWRRLTAAMNQPNNAPRWVEADPQSLRWPYDWESSKQMLLDQSPQVAALVVDIARARAALARQCAEPIPDVSAQVSVQYSAAGDEMLTGVQVGMPIPLWNRNQGGIGEARHQLAAAKHRLQRVELELTAQLAELLRQFEAAQAQADAYQNGILTRAQQNLDLTRQAYEAGESSYLELLTVQRTFFESNLDYLGALGEVNQSVQVLAGFLLTSEGE